MSRKIKCDACGLYLGEIRDAKLRKGAKFSCSDCSVKMATYDDMLNNMRKGDMPDFMKNIFGGGI